MEKYNGIIKETEKLDSEYIKEWNTNTNIIVYSELLLSRNKKI